MVAKLGLIAGAGLLYAINSIGPAPAITLGATALELRSHPYASESCSGYCESCLLSGHAADIAPASCTPEICQNQNAKQGGGWHTECSGANTCGNHACGGGGEADDAAATADVIASVGDALARGDLDDLARVLAAPSAKARLKTDRTAIQVLSCSGNVIAHIPLSEQELASLVRLESRAGGFAGLETF